MINIKTEPEIIKMRKAGKLTCQVLDHIEPFVKAGASTQELNDICAKFTLDNGGISAPLNYHGFPKSICTSINNVVCHGIPSETDVLKDGDIVNVDVTVIIEGYHGDASRTYIIGKVDEEVELLVNRTRTALMKGIAAVKPGDPLNGIGKAIENYITKFGYSIVRDYCGHGIGKGFHEEPVVCHYFTKQENVKMKPGMCFTIEPMINMGRADVITSTKDGWTVTTKDKQLSAQFEHTILVTETGYEILTEIDKK
jgi:methionyl aminopeptidase